MLWMQYTFLENGIGHLFVFGGIDHIGIAEIILKMDRHRIGPDLNNGINLVG